ncbi:MAG: alpha/beta hydrolase [Bacteroidaceae bacterium]|nr:alpha/beta hydrolase [Bacteroidaceae bacterium]
MLQFSLSPKNEGKNISGSWDYMFENYPELEVWRDSLYQANALKDTFIYAPNGLRLHAYYVAASTPTPKTAVIVHGYTDNAVRMMMIGYMYNRNLDYNILLPDLRYSGLSEGEAFQMGWLDRKDVMQWMDVANQIYGDSTQMVVHGISMGAATTMMVSGESLPEYVKCFVEDCGYTSVWAQFSKELKEDFGLPEFPLMYTTNWLCDLVYGWNFAEASAIRQVEKCKLPMLFIHGEKDDYVPTFMVYQLYEAKPQPKEIWTVPNADHATSYKLNKETYTEKVKQFTNKYIR